MRGRGVLTGLARALPGLHQEAPAVTSEGQTRFAFKAGAQNLRLKVAQQSRLGLARSEKPASGEGFAGFVKVQRLDSG